MHTHTLELWINRELPQTAVILPIVPFWWFRQKSQRDKRYCNHFAISQQRGGALRRNVRDTNNEHAQDSLLIFFLFYIKASMRHFEERPTRGRKYKTHPKTLCIPLAKGKCTQIFHCFYRWFACCAVRTSGAPQVPTLYGTFFDRMPCPSDAMRLWCRDP